MKKIIISTLALMTAAAVYAGTADTQSDGVTAMATVTPAAGVNHSSAVHMTTIDRPGQAPLVKIQLAVPATLTVFDQNGNTAFKQDLKAGMTTIDTANFPLGNDQIVVSSSQPHMEFTVTQNVRVTAPQTTTMPAKLAPAGANMPGKKMGPKPSVPAAKIGPAQAAPAAVPAKKVAPAPRTVAKANS